MRIVLFITSRDVLGELFRWGLYASFELPWEVLNTRTYPVFNVRGLHVGTIRVVIDRNAAAGIASVKIRGFGGWSIKCSPGQFLAFIVHEESEVKVQRRPPVLRLVR